MDGQLSKHVSAVVLSFSLGFGALGVTACDGSNSAVKDPGGSTSGGTSGSTSGTLPDGGKDCFENPTTHYEIINACTNATGIPKNPTLPRLLPDGGLPPLK